MNAKRLCSIWLFATICAACLAISVQAHGGGPSLGIAVEILRKLFPEANSFVGQHTDLSPETILNIEQALGDKLHESDKDLRVWVALANDPRTGKVQSIGAALVVEAEGDEGIVDVLVAYKLDGSVKKVLILNNRGDKSLESEIFLKQLEGRRPADGWNPQKDFSLDANTTNPAQVIQAVHRGMHLFLTFMNSWDEAAAGL